MTAFISIRYYLITRLMDKNKEAVLLHALMNKNQQYTKRRKKVGHS